MVSFGHKRRVYMTGILLRTVLASVVLLVAVPAYTAELSSSESQQEIVKIIKDTWEKPGMVIDVAPISVVGDYAVAGWVEGQRGGRALLKRRGHGWSVILCSGDGIKSAAGLTAAGLPAAVAQEMEMALSRAEATLPAHVVARFSLFEGSVPVENGAHADHHKH